MKVFEVYPVRYASLNVRNLINDLFFEPVKKHPDSTRQRKARQRELDRRGARELKGRYVPLRDVDPTVYLESPYGIKVTSALGRVVDGQRRLSPSERGRELTITGRWHKKYVQAAYFPAPNGEWRRHELGA